MLSNVTPTDPQGTETRVDGVAQGTWSASCVNWRWHCQCTRGEDAQAWGIYKSYCGRCDTEQPKRVEVITTPRYPHSAPRGRGDEGMSATDSDAFGRCRWCGNMTDSAGCLTISCAARTAREAVTSPTPDAVAQARQALDRRYESAAERGGYDVSAYCDARDALIAAVRAECALGGQVSEPQERAERERALVTSAWWNGWVWGVLAGSVSLAVLLTLLVLGGANVG